MSRPVRRGGRLVDDVGRTVTWSVAEGGRGRRWRWSVADKRGAFVAAHTVELDPEGRFIRLESAAGGGLLTLHREADGSVHGNRVAERGVAHLTIEAPAPELVVVGSTPLGLVAVMAGLGALGEPVELDVVDVLDDLGVRVVAASVRQPHADAWEVRLDRGRFGATVDDAGLPADSEAWPLETG